MKSVDAQLIQYKSVLYPTPVNFKTDLKSCETWILVDMHHSSGIVQACICHLRYFIQESCISIPMHDTIYYNKLTENSVDPDQLASSEVS